MPRRGYKKQIINDDPIYTSFEVTKLVNYIMKDGKKSVAQKLVYKALEDLKEQSMDPLDILEMAIDNVAPRREVRPRRVGGASYLVPVETRPQRKLFLALNWIIDAANSRSNKQYHSFDKKLSAELLDAYQSQGEAFNKKIQVEKLADSNKAFAHFSW